MLDELKALSAVCRKHKIPLFLDGARLGYGLAARDTDVTLKPVLTQNITLATFIDRDNHTGGSIVGSQKVGPSIADDIKTGAIYSVVLALIAIGLYILIHLLTSQFP